MAAPIVGAVTRAVAGALTKPRGASAISAADIIADARNAKELLGFGAGQKFFFPTTAHSITVQVAGGPNADLRRCWFLALAACFGRYRRGLNGVSARSLNAQWDVTGKTVAVTLAYTFGTNSIEKAQQVLSSDDNGLRMFYTGPDQVTIGESWPSWMLTTASGKSAQQQRNLGGGVPRGGGVNTVQTGTPQNITAATPGQLASYSSLFLANTNNMLSPDAVTLLKELRNGSTWRTVRISSGRDVLVDVLRELPQKFGDSTFLPFRDWLKNRGPNMFAFGGHVAPVLPDAGRVITTGEKRDPRVQPPRPAVDGVTRNHILNMVSAALSSPGVLPSLPLTGEEIVDSSGVYVRSPLNAFSGAQDFGVSTWLYPAARESTDPRESFYNPGFGDITVTAPNTRGASCS